MISAEKNTTSCILYSEPTGLVSIKIISIVFTVLVIMLSVGGLYFWKVNEQRSYLKVRSMVPTVLVTSALVFSLAAFPVHQFTLEYQTFLNRCETRVFLLFLAPTMLLIGSEIQILLLHNKMKLVELMVKIFAAGSSKVNLYSMRLPTPTTFTVTEKFTSCWATNSGRRNSTVELEQLTQYHIYRSSPTFARRTLWKLLCVGLGFTTLATLCLCPFGGIALDCDEKLVLKAYLVYCSLSGMIHVTHFLHFSSCTRGYPDPYSLKKERTWELITTGVSVSIGILLAFVPAFQVPFLLPLNICLYYLCIFLYHVVYRVYIARKHPEHYFDLSLKDILQHPVGRKLFQQHLLVEISAANLAFWSSVRDWKEGYHSISQELREKVADNIYRKFLRQEAEMEVAVNGRSRQKLESLMNSDDKYPVTLFDALQNETFQLMEQDVFYRFKVLPLYRVFMGLESGETQLSLGDGRANGHTTNIKALVESMSRRHRDSFGNAGPSLNSV